LVQIAKRKPGLYCGDWFVTTRRALFWIIPIFILLPLAAFAQTAAPSGQPSAPASGKAQTPGNNPQAAPSQQPAAGTREGAPAALQPAGNAAQGTAPSPAAGGVPATGQAPANPPPVAEASPINFRLSADGSVATILFDKDSIDAMKTVIAQLEQNGVLGKVKGVVYSSAGITPMLVLMGEKDELTQKLAILRQFIPDQSQAHMVVISASLRELQDEDAYYVGLTLSPDILGITLGGTGVTSTFQNYEAGDFNLKTQYQTILNAALPGNFSFSRIAQFQEAYNRGKVLVASEVYTRNGTKALLTNIQSIPIFTVDSNKNVATQYQNLETSVDVIPTTVEYNKEKPEESQVRIDALVKISVVTGTQSYKDSSAPSYATKTFATTRVLKANNERYIVGTFVNDASYKGQTGIPFLSKIPLLKYLFSQETNDSQRKIAILTLAVRLVPMNVKDLTIQVDRIDPLEELYKRKGHKPQEK
jgi:type II secretory pathway component GspD/PulD (secretin)